MPPLGGWPPAPVPNVWTWPPLSNPWTWPRRGGVPRPPLPPDAIEYWHGDFQLTAAAGGSWVGQIGGRIIPGVNNPLVGPSGTKFNGRTCARSEVAGSRSWLGVFAALALAGTRPWMFCISACDALNPAIHGYLMGTNGQNAIRQRVNAQTALWNSAASVSSGAPGNLNGHSWSTWLDGANLNLKLDGAVFTSAYAPAMLADMTSIAFGQDTAGGGLSDSSTPFGLICATKPSAAYEAALSAYTLALWGVA